MLVGFATREHDPADIMNEIAERLCTIRRQITAAESKFGRLPGSVKLLAVSKKKPLQAIRSAHQAEQTAFGENHLQEALTKIQALTTDNLEWHFIGPIQSNKTRPIAESFDWAHSVERRKVAARLNEQRHPERAPLNVCIQVNVSGETTKSGVPLNAVAELAAAIKDMPRLRLRGLMAIPRAEASFAAQRVPFKMLKDTLDSMNALGYAMDTLSMGMTDDMEAAIAEGSTLVRIGTAIFGARELSVAR